MNARFRRRVVVVVAALVAGLLPVAFGSVGPATATTGPCVVASFGGTHWGSDTKNLGTAFYVPAAGDVTFSGRAKVRDGAPSGQTLWTVAKWPLDQVPGSYTGAGVVNGYAGHQWSGFTKTENIAAPGWYWIAGLSTGYAAQFQVTVTMPASMCSRSAWSVNGSGSTVSGLVSDPVNAGSGSLLVERTGLAFGSGLGLERSFNGRGSHTGFLGLNWSTPLDSSLVPDTPGDPANAAELTYRDATGRVVAMTPDGNGGWTSSLVPGARAIYDAGSDVYLLTLVDGSVWEFGALRLVDSVTWSSGVTWTVSHTNRGVPTKLASSTGEWIDLFDDVDSATNESHDRLIDRAVTSDGRELVFHYDTADRWLEAVEGPKAAGVAEWQVEVYEQDADGYLDRILVQDSGTFAGSPPAAGAVDRVLIDNTYSTTGSTAGWVTSQVTEDGDPISFAYQGVSADGVAAQTVVTAGTGADEESFTYVHEAVGQLGGVTTSGTGSTSQSWSEHLLTQYESRRGGRTTATYDEDTTGGRLPTGAIEALGAPDPNTENTAVGGDAYTYCQDEPGGTDGDIRLRTHTDAAGVETRYGYGPDPVNTPCYGDLVADRVPTQVVVDPGGINAVTTVISTNGLIDKVTDPDGVVTEYGWDPTSRRLLWSAEDLDGDAVAETTTWFGYDAAGRLVVTRSPEGDESWTVYDVAGRVDLSYVTAPNTVRGCVSRTACDFSAGVPAGTPVASDATYTADGRLLATVDVAGAETVHARCWPAGGGRRDITVGPLRDGARARTDRVYDTAGRLDKVELGAAVGTVTDPAAVVADAQCAATMTAPVVTDYTYGELGRLEQVSSPGGVVTSYDYDDDGNVTATATGTDTTDDTATRRTAYDLRGRVTDEWGPTGDVDENSNPVRSHVRYHYDTADRLTETEVLLTGDSIDTAATGDVLRTWHLYDSAGRKVYDIVDLNGNDGTPQQDATGALTSSDFNDSITQYVYTPAGRLWATGSADADSTRQNWLVAPNKRRWTHVGYDPAGRAVSSWRQRWGATIPPWPGALQDAPWSGTTNDWWDRSTTTLDADGQITTASVLHPDGTPYATTTTSHVVDPATGVATTTVTRPSPADPGGPGTVDRVSITNARGETVAVSDWHDPATQAPAWSCSAFTADGLLEWSRASSTVACPAPGAWETIPAVPSPELDAYHAQVHYDYDLFGNRTVRRFWHQTDLASAPVLAAEVWDHDDDGRVTNHWTAGIWTPDPGNLWGSQPGTLAPAMSTQTGYEAPSGRIDTVTDPTGRVADYSWNNRGLLTGLTWTGPGDTITTASVYDAAGRRTARTDQVGTDPAETSTWAYDRAGNITTQINPTPNGDREVTYLWSLVGQPRAMVAPDGAWFQFSHDQSGRLTGTSACASLPTGSDPRDPATPLTACEVAGQPGVPAWVPVAAYDYDPAGLPTQVAMPTGQHRTWTRAANGSGVVTAYRQIVDQQLLSGDDDPTPPPGTSDLLLTGADLTYHPDGRLAGAVDAYDPLAVSTYTYDDAGQLEAATGQHDGDHTYVYGPSGLRLQRSIGTEVTDYTWAPGGQLTSDTIGTTTTNRAYDPAGRLTQTTDGTTETTWVHDAAGQPTRRTAGTTGCHAAGTCGDDSARRFDGDGRLIGVDDSTYVWDPAGAQLGLAEQILEGTIEGGWLNGTSVRANYGLQRLYVDWETPSGAGLAYWFAYDHHGSTIDTTAYDAPTAYDPYGVPDVAIDRSYGYRGELTLDDEVHLRARNYQPEVGLFTTRDPLDAVDGTPTAGNDYHYTDNDPLNKTDPTGMRPNDGTVVGFDSTRMAWWLLYRQKFRRLPLPIQSPTPERDACVADGLLPGEAALMSYGPLTAHEARIERGRQLELCRQDVANGASDNRKNPSGVTSGGAEDSGAGQSWSKVIQGLGCMSHPIILPTTCVVALNMAEPAERVSLDAAFRLGDERSNALNAARHFAWSALIASEVDPAFMAVQQTIAVTDIHEILGLRCPGTDLECDWDRRADERNNSLGAVFGRNSLRGRSLDDRKAILLAEVVDRIPDAALDLAGGCSSRYKSIPQGC